MNKSIITKSNTRLKRSVLFLIVQFVFFIPAMAQQYPVQGTLAINSPYPAYLSDYANPNIEKLILNLTLTDLTIANKRVKLKLFIQKQNSLIAQSADNIIGEPTIILDGGVPQRFTSIELAHYFKIENLQGINGDAYSQALPEGVYNIGFEVYDYFTGNKLSDRINQLFWLMLNDPPLLNMPRNHENILDANPNNPQIVFQWTPRTTQVTNTEYEFTLSELWDDAGDPYQQFLAAIPKYQTTTSNTTLLYGITEPPLLAGRTYAWRVKAKAKAGFEDIGLYRQNGYSEIFVFKYAGQCAAVQGVNIEVKGYDRMYITWQPNPNQNLYKVAYRKYTPSNNWEWHEIESFNTFLNLFDLEANTDYEIKVGGVCNDGLVSYSSPQTKRTLQSGQITGINCGQAPVIDLANKTLLQHLSVNEVVTAGDFPITITRVEGGSGVYSGEGWVKVPWLADTKIKVKYTGIKVNTDYKLLDGFFETTYDPTGANIGDIDQLIDDLNGIFTGGTDVGHVVTGSDTTKYHVDFDIPDPCTACTFTPDGHGGGTITFGGGKTLTVDKVPTTIKDANGDIYQVDKDGKVTKIGNSGGTGLITAADKTTIDLSKGRVDFAAATGMVYAFDAWQQAYDNSNAWAKKYEKLNGGDYRVSAKAIAPGKPDKVLAKISFIDNTLKADSIKFVNGKGTIYTSTKNPNNVNEYEITITGGPADDAQEIYALYPQGANKPLNLGKLLVASYAIQKRKVVLVPVNGAPVNKDSIANVLNRIYNKICVEWEVSKDENFENSSWDLDHDNSLKVDGSGTWSVFTSEMKALNNAYRDNRNVDSKSIYLFVLNQAATKINGVDVLGDMPRGKQFGYLFTNGGNGNNLGLTASHEVGHGAFRLRHVFDFNGITEQLLQPSNVMDYPSGEYLTKYEWDVLHDPGVVIGVFEDDGNAMSITYTDIKQFEQFKNTATNTYTFISPSGKYFTLPSDVKAVSFSTLDRTFYIDSNYNANVASPTDHLIPLGSLRGFVDKDNNSYNASFQGNTFMGYGLSGTTGNYFKEPFSNQVKPKNGIAVFLAVKNNDFITYVSKFKSGLNNQSYTPNDYTGAGERLKSFAIINLESADKSKTLEQILNQYKDTSIILNSKAGNLQFDNNSVLFYYKPTTGGTPNSVKEFLLDVLNENSTLKDYIAYFTLVNIKQNELQAFANCLGAQFSMNEADITMAIQRANDAANTGQLSDANSIYSNTKSKTLEELIALTMGDTTLLTNLKQAVQQNKSADDIYAVLKAGYKICALPALDINTRLYILNKFLTGNYNNNNWYSDPTWYSSNDGHFFVKDLIVTTPTLDRVALLKNGFMANNYEWLRNLWKEGNKWFNGVGYDEVHSIFDAINPWIFENYSQLNIPITVKPMLNTEVGNLSQVNYPAGSQEYVVGLDNDEIYQIPGSNFEYNVGPYTVTSDIDFKSTGRIHFKQGYWLEDVSQIVYNPDYPPARRATFVDYKEDFNPFEPLKFIVVDNFHEVGFSKGDNYIVPAYMVMVYDKDVDRTTTGRTVTKVVDIATIAAAIFTAPESGGTSLSAISAILTRAAGVVAAANIPLQYEINSLTPAQYNQNKNFYDAWEQLRTGINYANLAAGGMNFAWKNFGSYQKITTTFSTVKATLNSIPANLLPKLSSVWNQFKSITPTSTSGVTQVTINESKIFSGSSGMFVSNFDELVNSGQIAGFDDAFTKAIFNIGKKPGGTSFDDLIQLTGKVEHIPTIPGGTAADMEILSGNQGATAVQELTTKQVLKPVGQPLSTYSVTQSGSIVNNPAAFTNQVTVTKYALSTSTSTVPEAIVLTAPNTAPQLIYATAKISELIVNNEKDKQSCKQCQRYSQSICQKFEQLQTKAGVANTVAVSKLCSQLSATEVNSVLDYLLAMNTTNLNAFLSDILPNSNPATQHIANKVPLLNTSILQAWKRMDDKKSSGYRKDYSGLKELKNIVENSTTLQALGGDGGINTILEKNASAPCNTCQNNNNAYVYMDKYLNDVAYFASNYTSKPGYSLVVGNSGIKSGSTNQVNATAFILRVLQEHPDYKNSISGFEEKIETINDAGETNTAFADIIQYGDKIIECKSWGLTGIAFQKFVDGTSGSVTQFKTYLSDQTRVTSMDKIEYWFDAKKGVTEALVKEKFKAMMCQNNNLTQAGLEVFNAIWSNTILRGNLWNSTSFPGGVTESQARGIFTSWVSSLNEIFFKFIKVK